jgi:CheY-like chemotaxis protein
MPSTLLLADDSLTIQRVIELTFANEDIRVVATSDGDAAIRQIDAEPPDVVLADVGMPRVDGYAVAAHIKQTAVLSHIPVLLLAGAFDPIDEEKATASGCDGILVKPFEPQQLVRRVKELLARPALRAPLAWDEVLPPPEAPAEPAGVAQKANRDFDEIDAAFAALDAKAAGDARQATRAFGEWDLPSRPQPAARLAAERPPEPPTPPPQAPREAVDPPASGETILPGRTSKISMAAAFSALLAAEQAQPAAAPAPGPPARISDATIEDIVQRVLHRMTDDVVRRVVVETAERLIKQEIEKIRTASR